MRFPSKFQSCLEIFLVELISCLIIVYLAARWLEMCGYAIDIFYITSLLDFLLKVTKIIKYYSEISLLANYFKAVVKHEQPLSISLRELKQISLVCAEFFKCVKPLLEGYVFMYVIHPRIN